MRSLTQLAAIVSITAGAGLYAYSQHLDPPPGAAGAAAVATLTSTNSRDHENAALACGWGVAFITLGSLALVVPWVNIGLKNYRAVTATAAN